MSARETIASVMWHNMPTAVSMNTVSKTADAVLSALAKDGYRLLGPDELDPVTVRKCIEVVDAEDDIVLAVEALRSLIGGGR